MKIYDNILETVGKTPLIKLNSLNTVNNVNILAKLEYFNPTSSVKDRIALNMINQAEKDGVLKPGGTIIEPTSGNTGLGLAMVAAARGYKLIITMPETMSLERRHLLRHLGAEIILTPGETGMAGAVQKAEEILKNIPDAFMPAQFSNPANPESHYKTTAPEIWEDTEGKFDIFIAAVGTGGTLTGCGKFFKEKNNNIKITAVEPVNSAVLSGKSPG
jgi:cysteine synthase A